MIVRLALECCDSDMKAGGCFVRVRTHSRSMLKLYQWL